MFTDKEIKSQFKGNNDYIRDHIYKYFNKNLIGTNYSSSFDYMLANENFTTFNAVTNDG